MQIIKSYSKTNPRREKNGFLVSSLDLEYSMEAVVLKTWSLKAVLLEDKCLVRASRHWDRPVNTSVSWISWDGQPCSDVCSHSALPCYTNSAGEISEISGSHQNPSPCSEFS